MKGFGNLLIAISMVALAIIIFIFYQSENSPGFNVSDEMSLLLVIIGAGAVVLILAGIILRNVKSKKNKNNDKQWNTKSYQLLKKQWFNNV